MTKTGTDARRCVLPALGAGAALAAMLFASRLPVTLDFILPRRAGWPLFVLASGALRHPWFRGGFVVLIPLLFVGSLARFGALIGGAIRGRKWTLLDFLSRGLLLAFLILLLRWSFSIWFEVSQKVWFPFGSMNALEPFFNLSVCSALSFGFMSAVLTILSPRPVWRAMLAWAAANAFAAGLAFTAYGAWAASPPPDGGRRQFIVLTEEEGRPGQATYDLPVVGEPGPPLTGAGRLASLRARYELYAKLMDPAGLRSALVLGVKGNDDLARTILLQHLSSMPPSAEALSALGELADESAYRIGPMGATRIALAYAHLGDAARAEFWARRGAEGPRGIPAGLVDLSGGGALKPGRISGRLEGLRPLKIGLYRKTDPAEPYFLDAAGLVASAEPDAKGRFSFSGLTAGRYYLAFAFAAGSSPRVSGHRGDIALDARRAALDLPALTIK